MSMELANNDPSVPERIKGETSFILATFALQ